jgi:hypothetical protein
MTDTTTGSWRDLLKEAIRDPKERQRLASVIRVNPATLVRWASQDPNKQTDPRLVEIRALFSALPDVQEALLRDLIGGDLPETLRPSQRSVSKSEGTILPGRIYDAVLRATREAAPRFDSVCNIVIPQTLLDLDPQRLGMEIVIASCVPPRKNEKVRSLRSRVGQGTPPWSTYLEPRTSFLGAEALGGYAVMRQHWMMTPNVAAQNVLLPRKPSPYEVSAAAFPIMLEGAIAGCLIASSTQTDYFTEERLAYLDAYANLTQLAFKNTEFFSPFDIDLGVMPSWEVQRTYFANWRRRVAALQQEARGRGETMDAGMAEQQVLKQIEEELLRWQTTQELEKNGISQGV